MTALTLRDVEAVDSLALARLDDDGAPAAVTSADSHGSTKTAGNPVGRRRRDTFRAPRWAAIGAGQP